MANVGGASFQAPPVSVGEHTHDDPELIRRTLHLAERGRGRVSPNPLVGSVVVRDGHVIGEGFHSRHGERHAEVAALDQCAGAAAGATLYCNLEPCATSYGADHTHPTGKLTRPCTDRIIREGIGRVVVASRDPNPHVAGEGVRQLRAAGIEVRVGVGADEALPLNIAYFTNEVLRRPFVHLKVAQTLDGRIATRSGHSQWITDAQARERVHRLRAEHDAVLVGRGTAEADDPQLTDRRPGGEARTQPWRVVLDSHARLPTNLRLLSDDGVARTAVCIGAPHPEAAADVDERAHAFERAGATVLRVPAAARGEVGIDVVAVLDALWLLGVRSVLVEGGQQVYTSFVRHRLFDQLTAFIAPTLVGDGVDTIGALSLERLADAPRLEHFAVTTVGDQAEVSGFRSLQPIREAVMPTRHEAAATALAAQE